MDYLKLALIALLFLTVNGLTAAADTHAVAERVVEQVMDPAPTQN